MANILLYKGRYAALCLFL